MRETGKRLLWFAGLWLGGLAACAALAYGVRWVFIGLGKVF